MSAVGSEFVEYIARIELYGDKIPFDLLPPATPAHSGAPDLFEYDNSSCSVCDGYYGQSDGEPVCVYCHGFLSPDFASHPLSSFYLSEKTDDGDSGNDEPTDLNYGSERRHHRYHLHNVPRLMWRQESIEIELSPEEEVAAARAGAPGAAGAAEAEEEVEEAEEVEEVEACAAGMAPPPQPPSVQRSLHILSTPRPDDNIAPGIVEQLPPEVILGIFTYLDDLSLNACVCVCTRWRGLLRMHVSSARWATFTARRWPLFRPLHCNVDWYKMYHVLVASCFCRNCLVQMCVQSQPMGEENSWRRNRLRAELKIMRNDPPEGISAKPLDVKSCHWQASITGPVGSPYEGGVFFLYIQVPYGYPISPPVVRFLTKILHPNVSRHGDVGIDSVHHNWSLALTISKVLISIQSLLTDPYTAVCMEPQLGELYTRDRNAFETLARQWTWRYAMHDAIPPYTSEYD